MTYEEDTYEVPVMGFEWMSSASCLGMAYLYEDQNDNPFFVEGRGSTYPIARRFCSICPVVVDCLIEGLDSDVGFRGGCSPHERTRIRMALDAGISLESATEEIWDEHRAIARGGEVPDSKVWDDWIT